MEEKERELGFDSEDVEEQAEAEIEVGDGEPTPEAEVESEVEVENGDDTADEESPEQSPAVDSSSDSPEKMLTQSQVNELVGRARQEGRESAMRELFSRYGVSDDRELGDIFGLGQAYQGLNDEFTAQGESYKEALAENALLKSRADESRWEDIKLILGGKGLDITMENIESLIPSHPEWRTSTALQQTDGNAIAPEVIDEEMARDIRSGAYQPQVAPEKAAKVRRLGGEATPATEIDGVGESEEERLRRLFNI